MVDQKEIHNQCLSDDPKERMHALEQLDFYFSSIPDKQQAWNDLLRMTNDENWRVRDRAAKAISSVFSQVPDKQQAWNDLHRLAKYENIFSSFNAIAIKALGSLFSQVPDKQQAWNDLHRLTNNKYGFVRSHAAETLVSAFFYVPDKQQAWNDLHRLTGDKDWTVRSSAASALGSAFSYVPDKQQAWNDLHRLTNDEDHWVRYNAAFALGSAFSYVPDKQQAWNDLLRMTNDEDHSVRFSASLTLCSAFSNMPDRQQTSNDLLRLISDEDHWVRAHAADTLGSAFSDILDKQQAWDDLIRLTNDEDSYVGKSAARALGSGFFEMPDKQQAWNDLLRLTSDKDIDVRRAAASALGSAFSQVPDKQQAWNDLHRLINDEDRDVKLYAVSAIGSGFFAMPDKQQAWNGLHRLTNDESSSVRFSAASALGSAFSEVPDKQQAWNDLHRLINDEDRDMRSGAASALGSAFSYVPDKQQAWNDLHRLINDEDRDMRSSAASALGSAFSYVPDKQQAWNDLHRLTNDEDHWVRERAAKIIGSVFSQVPDKQQAWNDLHRLTNDEDSDVRASSNYSLGKVSIFRASKAETDEDYKKELEKAIEFFKRALQECYEWNNPAQFCLPFYRSFHAIIFKKQEAKEEEINKYLEEAKNAIKGSESKKQLFEAVKSLSEALKKVQNFGNLDLQAMKGELNFYRKYCDQAAELMKDTDDRAPFATEVLRKGLPILDRKLKELLEEIQQKAKTICQVSQGTATEEIACVIKKEVENWENGSQEEIYLQVANLISTLESKIPRLPENEQIFKIITENKKQESIIKLLESTSKLIEIIPEITIDPQRMKPTIGIITALPKEYSAVNILLENKNDKYKVPGSGAGRRYCLGEILSEEGNKHKIVLSISGMGNNIAATRASLLLEHFPNVKSIIMVGIAGGVPNPCKDKVDDHVRLGDIVVSNENGVIQYDLVKQEIQKITHRNPPRPPSASLMEAVRYLEAEEILGNRPWEKYIAQSLSKLKIYRPSDDRDILYNSNNQGEVIPHPEDPKRIKGQPRVFIGPVASANILQKDPNARDKLRDKFGVKAIEMEASGIADATWNHEVGYLVVRGICDYCDSHKNDDWQQYAAVVAAAYTRALIESMP